MQVCTHACTYLSVSEDNFWFSPIVWILDSGFSYCMDSGCGTWVKYLCQAKPKDDSVISALKGPRQLDYLEFEASLGSLVSSWPAWATK